jgi:hypothetical protein
MLPFCGGEVQLESEDRKVLSRGKTVSIAIVILLVLTLTASNPASSETRVCEVSGYDLAPKFIYTGEPHLSDLNDIPMLKIEFNTTYEEEIYLESFTLHRSGRASDSDVVAVEIFDDTNNNSQFDFGIDQKISTSNFELGKSDLIIGRSINHSSGLTLFVTMDIAANATSNTTLGIDIPDASFIDCQGAFIEFKFPVNSKNSTIYLDTDGDSNPDIYDADDDNDGYMDETEILSDSDPKDPFATPKDTDSDFVPDVIDTDDDNDGVLDKYDDFPKDKTRHSDYTVVIMYSIIAIFLIIIMLVVLGMGRPKIPKSVLEMEDGEEFKVGKKKTDFSEDIFEDDEDLIDEP